MAESSVAFAVLMMVVVMAALGGGTYLFLQQSGLEIENKGAVLATAAIFVAGGVVFLFLAAHWITSRNMP